uniref:Zasp-like motif domain-containing protein n=1 Tax=Megaselia scalaris TaxID=36166 RepID=T1GGA0_MEGSC
PYRSTPLVLPGPKVKKDAPTTESYLRHYPNPKVRAHPGQHDYHDVLMKQRVADTMLHKVVGAEADSGRSNLMQIKHIFKNIFKIQKTCQCNEKLKSHNFHRFIFPGTKTQNSGATKIEATTGKTRKQKPTKLQRMSAFLIFWRTWNIFQQSVFPICLYFPYIYFSVCSPFFSFQMSMYKKTVVYDPSKSDTFRAIQEEGYGNEEYIQEVTTPVQPKVFSPSSKMVPGKKLPSLSPRPSIVDLWPPVMASLFLDYILAHFSIFQILSRSGRVDQPHFLKRVDYSHENAHFSIFCMFIYNVKCVCLY